MRMKAGTRFAATLVAGMAALGLSATPGLASTAHALSHGSAATANSWTATAPMSTARATPTATALSNGRILVVGGATAELYDPVAGAWSPAGTLSQPRSGYFVAVRLADGRVLAAGGQYTASAELYDPATNSWAPTGSMNVGRDSFTGTLLRDGRVLVVGGNSLNSVQASAELYDPVTGRWTVTGSLPAPRWRHTATLLPDGTVLVAGGISSAGWPRDAE